MDLWRISQNVNDDYDTYDSAIVAAESEELARHTHPSGYLWSDGAWRHEDGLAMTWGSSCWTTPDNVKAERVGTALPETEPSVVLASFNAG